jgi:hypothetical protein
METLPAQTHHLPRSTLSDPKPATAYALPPMKRPAPLHGTPVSWLGLEDTTARRNAFVR